MLKQLQRIACCALTLAAGGCVTVHSYVETGHDAADFRDLHPRNPPTPVQLKVSFSVNGSPDQNAQANTVLFNEVVRTLRRTGVLVPVQDPTAPMLQVEVDDQYDKGIASHNGWISGLSLGSSGSTTRDEYHFNFTLLPHEAGGKPRTALYTHAMITLVGNAPPPGYGQPQDMDQAFAVIVKQSVLEFLHDMEGTDGGEPVMIVPEDK